MRHTQVLISVLLLLLPAAVSSFPEVHGVVGHPVTLPCSYPVPNGISSMCWGRGECRDTCGQTLIWTDGHRIYYQTSNRYQLKGQNLEGHVSLTIKNVTVSDSGLYCCRVEMKGPNGVQKLTISLQVQPEIPTSPPRGHTTITTSTTTSTRLTGAPKSTRISTSTPLPPSDTLTPKPGQHHEAYSSPHISPVTPSPRIYYQKSNRYQLKRQLLEGNVSLTIQNATESDSGLYCC
ncbi:hepatitis A virus cellular receptor 1 homolog [Cricetulus griseus]|uniref:Hepatitis A virus cellular receptor 1 homolog n=1 Tax=Cricetulus griseus TaxID=10029 RepID=A0A9J7H3C4_CRIGR|nr:hepatitis A virus cellular receptor 1 homolog [Cricetulus griseus]